VGAVEDVCAAFARHLPPTTPVGLHAMLTVVRSSAPTDGALRENFTRYRRFEVRRRRIRVTCPLRRWRRAARKQRQEGGEAGECCCSGMAALVERAVANTAERERPPTCRQVTGASVNLDVGSMEAARRARVVRRRDEFHGAACAVALKRGCVSFCGHVETPGDVCRSVTGLSVV